MTVICSLLMLQLGLILVQRRINPEARLENAGDILNDTPEVTRAHVRDAADELGNDLLGVARSIEAIATRIGSGTLDEADYRAEWEAEISQNPLLIEILLTSVPEDGSPPRCRGVRDSRGRMEWIAEAPDLGLATTPGTPPSTTRPGSSPVRCRGLRTGRPATRPGRRTEPSAAGTVPRRRRTSTVGR